MKAFLLCYQFCFNVDINSMSIYLSKAENVLTVPFWILSNQICCSSIPFNEQIYILYASILKEHVTVNSGYGFD